MYVVMSSASCMCACVCSGEAVDERVHGLQQQLSTLADVKQQVTSDFSAILALDQSQGATLRDHVQQPRRQATDARVGE